MARLLGLKAPDVKATRMPDLQDPAILEARRKKIDEAGARNGRESTMLSDALTGSAGKMGA